MNDQELHETLTQAKADLRSCSQFNVRLLSPLTLWLAKRHLRRGTNPNFLTLCMLLTVLVSLPFFFFGNAVCAIIGFLLIQWFEIYDDADGIVARGTGQLSIYGEQLDFLMHIICHPLSLATYAFAVFRTLTEAPMLPALPCSNTVLMLILFAVFVLSELGLRALIELDSITREKRRARGEEVAPRDLRCHSGRATVKMLLSALLCYPYPVFMQTFPLFLVIDLFAGTHIAFYVYGVFACLWLLSFLKNCLTHLLPFMRRA